MPRWILMWLIALALYGACKWLTYWQVRARIGQRDRGRVLRYLLAWPGMDSAAFLMPCETGLKTRLYESVERPSAKEWTVAGLKIALGILLTWIVARWAWPRHPLLAG